MSRLIQEQRHLRRTSVIGVLYELVQDANAVGIELEDVVKT